MLYKSKKSNKKTYIDYIMRLTMIFPIVQLFEEIVPMSNKILFILLVVLMEWNFISHPMKKRTFIYSTISILVLISSVFIGGMPKYNFNELFYFPFLVIYFYFISDYKKEVTNWFLVNKQYIKKIIYIYCIIIGIALLLPNSFQYGDLYFKPFGLSGFRSSPTAVFVYILIIYLMKNSNRKYLYLSIVPFVVITLGSSRTYLGVCFLIFMLSWYIFCKERSIKFFITGIAIFIILLSVYSLSPIAKKNNELIISANDGYFGYWGTITSGRSLFWALDIDSFFSSGLINKLFGHGLNFIYELNATHGFDYIWAHNDFVQILVDFGIIGLLLYLKTFEVLFKSFDLNKKKLLLKVSIILIWLLNAFFNMFYTYFCTMICYPFLLITFSKEKNDLKK